MITGKVDPSVALILAAAALCCWRWAPAGADKADRRILRGLGMPFAAGALVTPFAHGSTTVGYAAAALDIVPVGFLVFGALPGVKLSETILLTWRRARQLESLALMSAAIVAAIVWQRLT